MGSKPPLFHYTVGVRMRSILGEGVIQPALAYIEAGERPVVWLTRSEQWEPTCNKAIRNTLTDKTRKLDMLGTHQYAGGLFRIEVEAACAPHTAGDFVRLSGISKTMWRGMTAVARRDGSNISLWRVSFEPITSDHWLDIERWERGSDEWVSILPSAEDDDSASASAAP